MAEIAREHFESVGKGLSCHEQGRKEDPTEESRQLGQTKEPSPELHAPISLEEVKEAIKGMKRGKGWGDKINLEMIQGGGEILVRNIYTVLQCCWEEEYIPKEWMEGVVVPIYKEEDVTQISN